MSEYKGKRDQSLFLSIAVSIFIITSFFAPSSVLYSTPKLKFMHKKHDVNHRCRFCHHRKPDRCGICHTSGVDLTKEYTNLPEKMMRLHKKCRGCHKDKVKQIAQTRLKNYVRVDSFCLKCHK